MAARRVGYKADYIWNTPDDGNRYEVIDGELHVTPPPSFRHQSTVAALFLRVGQHVERHELGKLLPAPLGVVLHEETGIQPDLVYFSHARAGIVSERGLEGAPDLVVEVLSPSTRANDRGKKMVSYALGGIPFYWIVDPTARSLEEYRLGPAGYELVATLGPTDIFRPMLFPGLEIRFAELWT